MHTNPLVALETHSHDLREGAQESLPDQVIHNLDYTFTSPERSFSNY